MKKSNYMQDVRRLIARDELTKAIGLLHKVVSEILPDQINQVIILSMNINSLKKAIIQGRVSWKSEIRAKNKIAFQLLELISLLEVEYLSRPSIFEKDENLLKKNFKRA